MDNSSSTINRGSDGGYRWNYKVNLYTNPSIMFLVLKVMLLTIFITWLFAVLCCMGTRDFWFSGLITFSKGFGLAMAILFAITIHAYYLYALIMGGCYSINFTMDEKGVLHEQDDTQQKRAKIISFLAMLFGALAKNRGAVNAGRVAGRPAQTYSDFSKVTSIKPERKHHLINVNGHGVFNKVYVHDADFDWVLDFIKQHCPKARS